MPTLSSSSRSQSDCNTDDIDCGKSHKSFEEDEESERGQEHDGDDGFGDDEEDEEEESERESSRSERSQEREDGADEEKSFWDKEQAALRDGADDSRLDSEERLQNEKHLASLLQVSESNPGPTEDDKNQDHIKVDDPEDKRTGGDGRSPEYDWSKPSETKSPAPAGSTLPKPPLDLQLLVASDGLAKSVQSMVPEFHNGSFAPMESAPSLLAVSDRNAAATSPEKQDKARVPQRASSAAARVPEIDSPPFQTSDKRDESPVMAQGTLQP